MFSFLSPSSANVTFILNIISSLQPGVEYWITCTLAFRNPFSNQRPALKSVVLNQALLTLLGGVEEGENQIPLKLNGNCWVICKTKSGIMDYGLLKRALGVPG